ncbi:MAG TPA: methionyl-tRNA formyltransferase [Candidatus Acidoferrales bacterium]|nr:methionyl-tRNA formyltransferase [Candidatus Acidoferrales bacterium]
MALRTVFCGTPAFAVPSFESVRKEPDFQIVGVVTQPDRPRGRGQQVHSSPVKEAALAAAIPVYQPQKIKSDEAYEHFTHLRPDVVVIIAYGQIIPPRLIAIPRFGWINLHASLLPKYRGAAPINWAILNGEDVTGVTTMQIDTGLDTGPTLLEQVVEIGKDETAPELAERLARAGATLMVRTLRKLASGEITPAPQDHLKATFAPPLKKEDGRIDWSRPPLHTYNQIRGLQPWPGAFTTFRGQRCQIWARPVPRTELRWSGPSRARQFSPPGTLELLPSEVLVRSGESEALRLEFVQMEGRKRITAREFVNGARLAPGERFNG